MTAEKTKPRSLRSGVFLVPGPDGGVYEYRILALKKARNGDGGLRWNDLPLGAPFLYAEVLHLADNTVAQHERR